jgi:hypothetical protein
MIYKISPCPSPSTKLRMVSVVEPFAKEWKKQGTLLKKGEE